MINKIITTNCKYISKVCPIKKILIYNNSEISLLVKKKDLNDILLFFKNHVLFQFKVLTCISSVDLVKSKNRFKLVYELLSLRYNSRLKIKIFINELSSVNSCLQVHSSASWFECEIWDMFGVFFTNNPNLKRLLTDYGFEGFPLRKDFPLNGFVEVRFNEIEKKLINNKLELSQEFRNFNYFSPW